MKCVNVFKGFDMKKSVYRFVKFSVLMTLIERRIFSLRKLSMWEDTYEVPLKKMVNKEIWDVTESRFQYYGCCWSQICESDAMWRIYSPDSEGVCIATTIEKIEKTLDSLNMGLKCELFPVQYGNINEMINDELDNGTLLRKGYRYPYLYMKRNAFEHEKEIRLVVDCGLKEKETSAFFDLKNIAYEKLIDKIIFDSRAPEWYFRTMKQYLMRNGIASERSTLYEK